MNPYGVLAAAAARWQTVGPRLPVQDRERLAELLRAVRVAGAGDTADDEAAEEEAAEAAARLLLSLLEDAEGGRFEPGTGPGSAAHHGFTAADLAVLVLDGHTMVGPVLGPVRDRLLAASAYSPAELHERGGDPEQPLLIRLPGADGRVRLPAFQFTADGAAHPVVLRVNAVLAAEGDPWGAADWWLSANAWLGAAPFRLLGTDREGLLVPTARYLAEED